MRLATPHPRRLAQTARLAICVLCALSWTQPARAQGDASRAEALFKEAVAARASGDNATACAKFAESATLLERPSTLVNLAQCEMDQGKLGSAYVHAKKGLLAMAPDDQRLPAAKKLVDELAPRVPRITIKVPKELPEDARVRLDGKEVDKATLAQPIPVDPGEHEVSLTAKGYTDSTSTITVVEKDTPTIELTLGVARSSLAPAEGERRDVPGELQRPRESGTGQKVAGFVLGAVGVGALAVGGVFGILTFKDLGDAEDDPTLCPDKACTPAGREQVDGAETKGWVSTIALGAGAALVAAGTILVLTAPSGEEPKKTTGARSVRLAPAVAPGTAGLTAFGRF